MVLTMFMEMQGEWGFNRLLFGKVATRPDGTGLAVPIALVPGSYFGQWRAAHRRTGYLCIGRCLEASAEQGVLMLGLSEPVQILGLLTRAAHIKLARRWIASCRTEQLQDEATLLEAMLWLSVGKLPPQRSNA